MNGHVLCIIFRMSQQSSLAADFYGEIIPADITAFIGGMVVAVFFCLDHVLPEVWPDRRYRWEYRIPVAYNGECIPCFSQIQHSLDEVFAVFAKDPGNADDKVVRKSFGNCQLTL